MKDILNTMKPLLPYGCFVPWKDLNFNPKLYHAVHIYWLKFYGLWYNTHAENSIQFWLQLSYCIIVLWLVCFLPCAGEIVYLLKRRENIGDIAEGY
ncbi:hypothetical protein EVAR_81364_1 [Eumeta japonica]|uniref:Uncharacterized protein n=1 Tax=Eumeta variegata TaxID=151549 RepID=A0A4C1XD36_EUMVA|nr:hypothetical protein EVAR_81364_1 [Eumeta japonica]